MTERQGVEIDYCPQCRGVWLDRGELDKIIDKSALHNQPPVSNFSGHPPVVKPVPDSHPEDRHHPDRRYHERHDDHRDHDYERRSRDYDHDRGHDYHHGNHKRKKEGFLRDLFDF